MKHRISHLLWPLVAALIGVTPAQAVDGVGLLGDKGKVTVRYPLGTRAAIRTKHTNQDHVDPPDIPEELLDHTNQDRTLPGGEEPPPAPPPSPGTPPIVRPELPPLNFDLYSEFLVPVFSEEAVFVPYVGGGSDRTDGVLSAALGADLPPLQTLDFLSSALSRDLAVSQVTIQAVPGPAVLPIIGLAVLYGRRRRRHT